MVGILPTVRDDDLQPGAMSPSNRYAALTAELFRLRNDAPVRIRIEGEDALSSPAGTSWSRPPAPRCRSTSRSIRKKPRASTTPRRSSPGPLSRRAPTRPSFMAIPLGGIAHSRFRAGGGGFRLSRPARAHGRARHARLDYARRSLLELFLENIDGYPALLPALAEEKLEKLPHLRLQNGTIWRWNRPILGFDGAGEPHLRIEHRRCRPAPPSPTWSPIWRSISA
ncbi:MAG: hypothetical protein R3C55_00790 [Parvularculaceae bacterium]